MSEKMADPISLRLPAALRESIYDAAKQASRSLNAEIRMRLEASFQTGGFDGRATDQMLANEVESIRDEYRGTSAGLRAELAELRERIEALESKRKS